MRKINGYYMTMLLFIGGTIGCLTETIWCYFDFGTISSRTSNFFFPFSMVWGLGTVVFSILFMSSHNNSLLRLFMKGYFFGGVFEFICGMTGQLILGVTFSDYSALPFSLGRYINLIFCCFWGGFSILWVKVLSPLCIKLFHRIPAKVFSKAAICIICFLLVTEAFTGAALLRMSKRESKPQATNVVEYVLDACYPNEVIAVYFPKMKSITQTSTSYASRFFKK